ncbi:hypothetical protein Godav_004453 [Gossypium davidsonii]|uniref:Uncharacterized protein n=1 Tax=Gossypium davidsonii TaxID=34287 RepID=A0A7J8SL95_GOSDV|nr:hypothetical protein [Gossypium davidsonii]
MERGRGNPCNIGSYSLRDSKSIHGRGICRITCSKIRD